MYVSGVSELFSHVVDSEPPPACLSITLVIEIGTSKASKWVRHLGINLSQRDRKPHTKQIMGVISCMHAIEAR
jgi:hypothetical protein